MFYISMYKNRANKTNPECHCQNTCRNAKLTPVECRDKRRNRKQRSRRKQKENKKKQIVLHTRVTVVMYADLLRKLTGRKREKTFLLLLLLFLKLCLPA